MNGKPRSNAIPWTAFLLGAGASIAANVAHAAERNSSGTDIGAMLFAAWAPVALLLVAEMMVRGQRPRGLLSLVEWVGAFLVALAAAVVSYGHMRGLLLQYGESELVAVLLPLSVDGLVVVASVALAAGRRNKVEQQRTEERTEERKEQRKEERTERKVRVPVVEVESSATIPVTVTPPHSAERRSAVEWAAEQLRSGATLTGAEIGARYGRTDRWGRNVLRDARQQLAAAVPA